LLEPRKTVTLTKAQIDECKEGPEGEKAMERQLPRCLME
jgi:hypothetical protein